MEKFLAQLEAMTPMAAVAFVFSLIRVMLLPNKNLSTVLLTVFVAVPVGTLGGMLALELGFQTYSAFTISSLCSLLGHDIVIGIVNNKSFLSELLKRTLNNIVDKVTR